MSNAIDMKSFKIAEGTPGETCTICLDEAKEGLEHRVNDTVVHQFHTDCATPWVNQNNSCPLCRSAVTSINGEPLVETINGVTAPRLQTIEARASNIDALITTHATAGRLEVLNSIAVVNALVPPRFNADGTVAVGAQIDEQAAGRARSLLAARLNNTEDAEYFAHIRGGARGGTSSVMSRVAGAITRAATSAYAVATHQLATVVGVGIAGAVTIMSMVSTAAPDLAVDYLNTTS